MWVWRNQEIFGGEREAGMNWLRRWWKDKCRDTYWSFLSTSCPGFYTSMPEEDKPGTWVACAIRTNPFSGGREVYSEEVEGLVSAYVRARELALKLDRETPYADGELGVNWAVRRKEE